MSFRDRLNKFKFLVESQKMSEDQKVALAEEENKRLRKEIDIQIEELKKQVDLVLPSVKEIAKTVFGEYSKVTVNQSNSKAEMWIIVEDTQHVANKRLGVPTFYTASITITFALESISIASKKIKVRSDNLIEDVCGAVMTEIEKEEYFWKMNLPFKGK